MFYTKEDIETIIRQAFKEGEYWGSAYEGWFSPTEDQTEEKIQEAIGKIMN